jgi:hypothetical protein
MSARTQLAALALLALALAGPVHAGDDSSIQGDRRSGIQRAMTSFVEVQAQDGRLLHYDPVADRLVRLRLVELHSGIVQKGGFNVSCADFTDEAGVVYDMDFLVLEGPGGYRVNQAIVHSVAGQKREYHLEKQ